MALVSDTKSTENMTVVTDDKPSEDLEDGEIEDDEEEQPEQEQSEPPATETSAVNDNAGEAAAPDAHAKHERKKKDKDKPLTEAEKSVMRLHKLERKEREKREKYLRRDTAVPSTPEEDDYAAQLEKVLAKVLKKDKAPNSNEEDNSKLDDVSDVEMADDVSPQKKSKKRKKKEKHNKRKKVKHEGQLENESDMPQGDPGAPGDRERNDESFDSDSDGYRSDDHRRRKHKKFERRGKYRERSRERMNKRNKNANKRSAGVCLYYLQGLCDNDNCPYSHEVAQPMKMELCKFYLQECCAKGDKCLYMHGDFPCKYYHTGLPCPFEDDCKFAHGGPLSDALRQILFKHIETAPKDLLGNFPRLSRENASVMIIQAQKNLELKYGPVQRDDTRSLINANVPSLPPGTAVTDALGNKVDLPALMEMNFSVPPPDLGTLQSQQQLSQQQNQPVSGGSGDEGKREKRKQSRWQNPGESNKDDVNKTFNDQDFRFSNNGDVDMRVNPVANPSLLQQPPPLLGINPFIKPLLSQPPPSLPPTQITPPKALITSTPCVSSTQFIATDTSVSSKKDGDLSSTSSSSMVDIEKYKMEAGLIKVNPPVQESTDDDDEPGTKLQIVSEDESPQKSFDHLPKTQQELFKRIQNQQRDNSLENAEKDKESDAEDNNINWYSDDEDDDKLMIKDDYEEEKAEPDYSKIEIPADVSALLSSLTKIKPEIEETSKPKPESIKSPVRRDPRLASGDPRKAPSSTRTSTEESTSGTTEAESNKTSIYDTSDVSKDVDLRKSDEDYRNIGDTDFRPSINKDVDLRQLDFKFKAIQNYTPASEIDASIHSHLPMTWRLYICEIPKPNYTGLKLSINDAQTTEDPRIKQIFNLTKTTPTPAPEIDESPASPSASPPKQTQSQRVDPRRKKAEEQKEIANNAAPLTYNQQLSMLQSSPFYQSLTSNQKLMLNQELAHRAGEHGTADSVVAQMLQTLGLIPPMMNQNQSPANHQAMNILANFQPNIVPSNVGPGLLGAGPPSLLQGAPIPPPIKFDPRNKPNFGGGNNYHQPPPDNMNNYDQGYDDGGGGYDNYGGGYNDDYYPEQQQPPPQQPPPPMMQNNFENYNNRNNFRDRPPRRGRGGGGRNNRNFFRRQQQQQHRN